MEMKFEKTCCRHLHRVVDQLQTQEQTLEVRLPESMPDIGRVLGAWGKMIVRSKEWRSGGMGVSGGVMAWVLYAPEDGSEPRSMECWIPFQLKWDFPETRNDGFILALPRLKSIDARSISARKMMVRANVSAWGQGLETGETEISVPSQVPEDVQLKKETYPMELPCEAGEKMVEISDEVDGFTGEKILRYDVRPMVTESKVVASRLVCRGKAMADVLYLSDGKVHTKQFEVPFSQYADLDREYSSAATPQIHLMLTNQEVEVSEGRLQVKCSICAQYVICDRCMVELVADAYSTKRPTQLDTSELALPARLDERTETVTLSQTLRAEAESIVDVAFYPEHPQRQRNGDGMQLGLGALCEVLYYDKNGELQCTTARMRQDMQLNADALAGVDALVGDAQVRLDVGEELTVAAMLPLTVTTSSASGLNMVTGMTLGEERAADEDRPSLILRRCSDAGLWSMAKECGSTVADIRRVNHLSEDPQTGKMLLIPIL